MAGQEQRGAAAVAGRAAVGRCGGGRRMPLQRAEGRGYVTMTPKDASFICHARYFDSAECHIYRGAHRGAIAGDRLVKRSSTTSSSSMRQGYSRKAVIMLYSTKIFCPVSREGSNCGAFSPCV